MYETVIAILFCAEYNFKKLKEFWGEPKSPEQALLWMLRLGLTKCVGTLLLSEIYHWNTINCDCCGNIKDSKKSPVKLRQMLFRLINNSTSAQTECEQITKLRKGVRKAIIYLRKIKADQNYLNSMVLQNVQEYLQSLLEMEPPQIIKTYNLEDLPMQ
ncbi:MAG: hypothetical protein PHH77_09725 [Victivallaceae bacterium]|nr:hypothetical protein [Victivallaceae bacterium]